MLNLVSDHRATCGFAEKYRPLMCDIYRYTCNMSVLLVILLCAPSVIPDNQSQCKGSLMFHCASNIVRIHYSQPSTELVSSVVTLQGCGCYRLYERRRWKAVSTDIKTRGDPPHQVRSIYKFKCDSQPSPSLYVQFEAVDD